MLSRKENPTLIKNSDYFDFFNQIKNLNTSYIDVQRNKKYNLSNPDA